jgi:bifunctional non-homologous end joining protein LigD
MGAGIAGKLPKGEDWIFEVKWDGVRGLVYLQDDAIAIRTRNNNRCERQYPELLVLPHYLDAREAVIDGEIVVLDDRGISSFELIQPRIHTQDAHAIAKMGQKNPVHLYVFDLLYLDGFDLRKVPLLERKRALAEIVRPFPLLRISDHFTGGEELLEVARQSGLEGLIAKRAKSAYESRRSQDWLKMKLTTEQEFVIGGYTPGERDTFGSLAIGYYDDDDALVYAGNVGTGFNETSLRTLFTRLQALAVEKKPFARGDKIPRGTVWVKPELVAQVKFANWTEEARLRAPVYLGLRNDKPAVEVAREEPAVHPVPADPKLKFTNLDKIYFPDDGYTKGDLIRYYDAVAPLILPHLKDRPLSLKRYPNGIRGEYFFQKNTPDNYPSWLQTETVDGTRYILANDKTTLLYLTNLGCIDQNPWMSRVGSLDRPDFILVDIDPYHCEFRKVVEAALLVKKILDAIGLRGYPKTTGGDGLHIYIPVEPVYSYDQARSLAEVIARLLAAEHPKLFTTPRAVEKREKDRVYFDWMQIASSKTISAPYVVRAHPGAPVSTPLAWDEVKPTLLPSQFTMKNAPARFAERGDLFAEVIGRPQRLEKALEKLEKLVRK